MSDHDKTGEGVGAAQAKKPGMLGKLVALSFLVAVIGGECLVACFYLPSVAASQPSVAEHAAAGEEPAHDHAEEHAKPASQREVDLGKFSLTSFQPATNTTLLIDFHLFGTVANEHGGEEEASGHGGGHGEAEAVPDDEFSRRYEKHKHRIRDQIITIVRSAEITDFADPSLGLIRRKILEKSNRTLGKPLLEEVIFSDFSLIEQ